MQNTLTKEKVCLSTLPNGDPLHTNIFTIKGSLPGPHIYIQSSVHGAELQGNEVIFQLLQYFSDHPLQGSITLVPLANPRAVNQKSGSYTAGRFNSVTGENWNRLYANLATKINYSSFCNEHKDSHWNEIKKQFKNLIKETIANEQKKLTENDLQMSQTKHLNLYLQELSSKADILLDLHTGPIASRYLYSAEYQKEISQHLLSPFTLIIPNQFAGAMDEAFFYPWIQLKDHFKQINRDIKLDIYSFTMELGSEEVLNTEHAKNDCHQILNFLNWYGSIKEYSKTQKPKKQHQCLLKDFKSYTAPTGGLYEYLKKPGQKFEKGEIIATYLQFQDIQTFFDLKNCKKSIVAPEDGIIINHNPSSSVIAGECLFQVMTQIL